MKHITTYRKLVNHLALSACLALLAGCTTISDERSAKGQWLAAWGASPFTYLSFGGGSAPGPYENTTVRQIVRTGLAGSRIRVRLSNEHSSTPLVIGAASVGLVDEGASVQTGSLHALTFGGEEGIIIPPGAPALSDPVELDVAALDEIAISLFLPDETPVSTVHMGRIAYLGGRGDQTDSITLPEATADTNLLFLSGVLVYRDTPARVVVALGDSITDGTASTPYTFNSWPDHLTQRLANAGITDLAVINQGISGNQVLRDGAGISALARFDRDVMATPGLSHIVIMEGINDIGSGGMAFFGGPGEAAPERTAADIIAGYRQLINRAHSLHPDIKILGATLTPFKGTAAPYYSASKDRVRNEVNAWIRNSGEFDGVVDFDLAIQDPQNPDIIKAEYNSGDNLHPGDLGYRQMAESIDLRLFE